MISVFYTRVKTDMCRYQNARACDCNRIYCKGIIFTCKCTVTLMLDSNDYFILVWFAAVISTYVSMPSKNSYSENE